MYKPAAKGTLQKQIKMLMTSDGLEPQAGYHQPCNLYQDN